MSTISIIMISIAVPFVIYGVVVVASKIVHKMERKAFYKSLEEARTMGT